MASRQNKPQYFSNKHISSLKTFIVTFTAQKSKTLNNTFGNVNVCIMKFRKSVTGSCFMTVHDLRNRTCFFGNVKKKLTKVMLLDIKQYIYDTRCFIRYGVNIPQVMRYCRASAQCTDILDRAQLLTQNLLKQGYVAPRLNSSLQKVYGCSLHSA